MRTNINTSYILDINRRFHDEVEADTYDLRMGAAYDKVARARMINELEHVLGAPLPKGGKVLDAAAGTGNISVKLAKTNWFDEVIAIDISSRSLAIARQNARSIGTNIITLPSDMQTLPFEDNSMDMLVGCAFLHHLPEPDKFMKEVLRVLKPGAPFIIIGEPTSFGANAINVTKLPLVLINRLLRRFKKNKETLFNWDHDNIDVHDFTRNDAALFLDGFDKTRIITQGFLEPIIDQGILTPIRHVLGENKIVGFIFTQIIIFNRFLDMCLFNNLLPKFMRVTLKISGYKPK